MTPIKKTCASTNAQKIDQTIVLIILYTGKILVKEISATSQGLCGLHPLV